MTTIQLTRKKTNGKAVHGTIVLPFEQPIEGSTLENADHLIPAGTYPLKKTWSPRFKKMMPEICDVPERNGIRIHLGTKPEHSSITRLMPTSMFYSINSTITIMKQTSSSPSRKFDVFKFFRFLGYLFRALGSIGKSRKENTDLKE